MTYAILSDIHGNLEALLRALEEADTLDAGEIIVLGDIVGYGPNPNECIDLCRERASVILMGNHDKAAIEPQEAENFNHHATRAVAWTAKQLSRENREFIAGLPLLDRHGRILFVHASPYLPEEWHYVTSRADAGRGFESFTEEICFVGHSHFPIIYGTESTMDACSGDIALDGGERYIINVGSVGQPRDRDPRLSFGFFDDETSVYKWVRAEYDLRTTAKKIIAAGLPSFLADRLFTGE